MRTVHNLVHESFFQEHSFRLLLRGRVNGEDALDLVRGVAVHRRQDVRIDVHRHRHRRVPEPGLRDPRRDPGAQELGRVPVPETMQRAAADPRTPPRPGRRLGDVARPADAAGLVARRCARPRGCA
jgi:hypothetical protein